MNKQIVLSPKEETSISLDGYFIAVCKKENLEK